jgi:cysteine desulfurase family protein
VIYFDNAATTLPKPDCVKTAVADSIDTMGNYGRGAYEPAVNSMRVVYDTRCRLAKLFGVSDPSRIAFTLNATDSLNMAIQGTLRSGDHAITTMCEHNSVLRPLYMMEKRGVELSIVKADELGRVNYEDIENAIRHNTKAVVINHASNLTGNVTDLDRVASITRKHNILLIVDAAQTAGIIDINTEKTGIDILCFTGHKGLMGVQGTGGIYVRDGVEISPVRVGGSGIHSYDREHPHDMPECLEAGTLNANGIAGLNSALKYIEKVGIENIYYKEEKLAKMFVDCIKNISGVKIYGDLTAEKRTAIVTINIDGINSDELCNILWEDYEICVRSGAHCAPLMHKALGTEKMGAVRFSFSYFNTEDEINTAIKAIKEIAR